MHRVLERQIQRYLGAKKPEDIPKEWAALLQIVSDTYTHSDEDRTLLTRSLELSSGEFVEINKKLKSENEIVEQKVKERTAELDYERQKLDEVARHMATGAILVNKERKTDFVNAATFQFLNFVESAKAVEVLAERFSAVPIQDYIERALKGEPIDVAEADALNKIFSLSFVPLRGETDTAGILIWLQDITEQKLLEREKNQFVAIASHEMRTPLTVIRGNAELLLEDDAIKGSPDIKSQIESMLRGAVRLLSIVNDFLEVQNIQDNRISLKIEPTDIVQVLKDTVTDLTRMAVGKKLSLVFDAASVPALPVLNLDKYRLQQIFINLISNAVHYTEKGEISIAIEKHTDMVRVLFKDTGVGMGPDEQTRLFKKFQTGNAFLHSKEYGSGLGLYISKFLARLMGGDLTLEKSEAGVGSVFLLTLPLPSQVSG